MEATAALASQAKPLRGRNSQPGGCCCIVPSDDLKEMGGNIPSKSRLDHSDAGNVIEYGAGFIEVTGFEPRGWREDSRRTISSARKTSGAFDGRFSATIPSTGALLSRLSPANPH
jgi:hypothetical protein